MQHKAERPSELETLNKRIKLRKTLGVRKLTITLQKKYFICEGAQSSDML